MNVAMGPGDTAGRPPALEPAVARVLGAAAPISLLVLAGFTWWVGDRYLMVGPFDRAQLQLLAIVLVGLTPGVTARARRSVGGILGELVLGLTTVAVATVAAVQIGSMISQLRCDRGVDLVGSIALTVMVGGGVHPRDDECRPSFRFQGWA